MAQGLRTAFDREFRRIQGDLLKMSEMVDWAIEHSIKALQERDLELAAEVIARDDQLNDLRYHIEEACLTLIATQQPIARDLRAVVATLHMAVEIERMGDYAVGIAKSVIMISQEPLPKSLEKIPQMGGLSRQMLADGMQAYLQRDASWAEQIAVRDDEMDQLYRQVFDQLVEAMAANPEMVAQTTFLMWCAHNLERIADRVTNIAERVVFMTTGDLQEFE
jgi:phosphate transport system protein